MVKTIISDMNNDFIISKDCNTYIPRRSMRGFIKWMKKKQIKPGDVIPNRIFKKYWKKEEVNNGKNN